jgi:hypothetical protein
MSELSSPIRDELLCGIFAKTERAEAQIVDLNQRISAFFQSRPYEMVSKLHRDGTKEIWSFRLSQKIPPEIPVIIGEILHNVRSPLDQILCAIAIKSGESEEGVAFPRGRTRDEVKRALSKQNKLPTDARQMILRAKPYRDRGNKLLWALLEMNRRDKHRVGLIPVQMPAEASVSYLCFWVGLGLVLGNRRGQRLLMQKPYDPSMLGFTGKPHALYDARPGRIHFARLDRVWKADFEFMTTTPGAKFDTDFQPAMNIAFDQVGVRGQPVVAVLNDMRDLVQRLLLAFEKRFF